MGWVCQRLRVTQGGTCWDELVHGASCESWCWSEGLVLLPDGPPHLEFISQALEGTLGACRAAGGTS